MTDEEMIRKAENPAPFYPSGERSAGDFELFPPPGDENYEPVVPHTSLRQWWAQINAR